MNLANFLGLLTGLLSDGDAGPAPAQLGAAQLEVLDLVRDAGGADWGDGDGEVSGGEDL